MTTETLLPHGRVLTFEATLGSAVTCRTGTLWLTQDLDPRDIVLEAGESFVLDRPGRAVLQPLGGPATALLDPRLIAGASASGAWSMPLPVPESTRREAA